MMHSSLLIWSFLAFNLATGFFFQHYSSQILPRALDPLLRPWYFVLFAGSAVLGWVSSATWWATGLIITVWTVRAWDLSPKSQETWAVSRPQVCLWSLLACNWHHKKSCRGISSVKAVRNFKWLSYFGIRTVKNYLYPTYVFCVEGGWISPNLKKHQSVCVYIVIAAGNCIK